MCLDDPGSRYAEPDPAGTWPKSKRKVPGVSPFSTHICHVSASLPALSATGMVPSGVRVGCRRGKTTHLSFHAVETSFASREKLLLGPPINKPCQETVLFIHTKSTHYNEAPQCFAVLSLPTCPISQRLGLPDRPMRNKCKKKENMCRGRVAGLLAASPAAETVCAINNQLWGGSRPPSPKLPRAQPRIPTTWVRTSRLWVKVRRAWQDS